MARREEFRKDRGKGSVTQKATSDCRHKLTEIVTNEGQKFLTNRRKGKIKRHVKNGTNHGDFNGDFHRF